MPNTLIELMTKFSASVRRYRAAEMEKVTGALGLSERDVAILEFVSRQGSATFADIARELRLADVPQSSASTISQTITALWRDRGLVEKRPNPADQRQPIVSLTDKGKETIGRIHEVQADLMAQINKAMKPTSSEANVLKTVFSRGIENFEKLVSPDAV